MYILDLTSRPSCLSKTWCCVNAGGKVDLLLLRVGIFFGSESTRILTRRLLHCTLELWRACHFFVVFSLSWVPGHSSGTLCGIRRRRVQLSWKFDRSTSSVLVLIVVVLEGSAAGVVHCRFWRISDIFAKDMQNLCKIYAEYTQSLQKNICKMMQKYGLFIPIYMQNMQRNMHRYATKICNAKYTNKIFKNMQKICKIM